MSGNQIVDFSVFHNFGRVTVSLAMATWLVVVVFVILITFLIIKYHRSFHYGRIKLKKIVLNFPGGKAEFEIERNPRNLEIAHKILIELITRKAAIPIEEDKDVITEIYDSWYALFCTTRDEIKLISGELLKYPKSKTLVEMATDVLNKGLRPHLTEYQARFRRWYELELQKEDNKGLSPQEVQKKFTDYDELISSIKGVNKVLIQYANQLKKFIYS